MFKLILLTFILTYLTRSCLTNPVPDKNEEASIEFNGIKSKII